MQLDIKKAILLPFSGKNWLLRLIILSILSMSIIESNYKNINSTIILIGFLSILLFGYFCQFAYNSFNNISRNLPSWKLDFSKYLRHGTICLIGILIYAIIFGCIALPFTILAEKSHSIYLKYLYEVMNFLSLIFIIFVVPCLYAENYKFNVIFELEKLFKKITNVKLEFLICYATYIILTKLNQFIFPYIKVGYMQIIFVSILSAITYAIVFDLFIQTFILAKQSLNDVGTISIEEFENIDVKKEISRWNWGAFFFTWMWGIFNRSYWTLLAIIPGFGLIWTFVCGLNGNEWTWKNKKWESAEQFHSVQKKWALYTTIYVVVVFVLGVFFKEVRHL